MVAEQSCVLRRWFALEPCTDGYVGRATGAVGTSTAPGWEHTASSELQDYDSGNGHSCDQLHLPRWSICVCSGSRLSLLATKHHGRAGASSCFTSQRQSLGTGVGQSARLLQRAGALVELRQLRATDLEDADGGEVGAAGEVRVFWKRPSGGR